jgi:hypothetical protein
LVSIEDLSPAETKCSQRLFLFCAFISFAF